MRILMLAALAACCVPSFGWAGGKKGGGSSAHPVARLAAEALGTNAKDIQILAVANPLDRENNAGSAALIKVDDGRDGGLANCHLLELAGKPYGPGKIEAQMRTSVCPQGAAKGVQLARVALSGRHEAWQVRLETARYDSKAQGGETAILWGLYVRDGSSLRGVWERTSTTFKSKADPAMNQAEVCSAPQISQGSQDPDSVTVDCDTETMAGNLPKRRKQSFKSTWQGDRYVQN